MARLNDFMVCPELAHIYNYCLANGTAATYSKGQSFVDEGALCRYGRRRAVGLFQIFGHRQQRR